MRALGKKLGALGLVLLMAVGTVACGDSSQTQAESTETAAGTTTAAQTDTATTAEVATTAKPDENGAKAVITVNGKVIPLSIAKFFIDQQKTYYEQTYSQYNNGDELKQNEWYQEVPGKGVTFAEDLQESCKDSLIGSLVVSARAKEYEAALDEEQESSIKANAAAVLQNVGAEKAAAFGLTQEHLEEFLRYNTLSNQIYSKYTEAFSCEVSDEEARTVTYKVFAKSTEGAEAGGDQLPTMEEAKANAAAALARIQAGEDASEVVKELLGTTVTDDSVSVGQFDESNEVVSKILAMKAGDVLVHEDPEVFTVYGIYCVSDDDAEGREARKEEIRHQKADESFNKMIEQWQTESEILVDETLWDQINIFES